MKTAYTCILALLLLFTACKESNKEVIEIASPKQMYEALYSRDVDAQLLDVRTEEEYGVSHLKDAQNICVTNADFAEKVKTLDKNKPVYVYCKKGGRSAKAAKILEEMGFTKVYDLEGGITQWEEDNLETEK
tara:strand:- start:8939 stop:9334 length:396 start_codon:yes stop_codon:yes gene_type:complete